MVAAWDTGVRPLSQVPGQGSDTSVPSRHSLRSLKIFELYLDMQIISCIIVDGLALLNFLFNYLHYVLGGTGSADWK